MERKGERIASNLVLLASILAAFFYFVPYIPEIMHIWLVGIHVLWGAWLFFLSGGV